MKKKLLFGLLFISFFTLPAPAQTASALHETAKAFMRQGDYANAVLVLNRSLLMEPLNTETTKDLAMCYYYRGENEKALMAIKTVLDKDDADDQVYQIAGNIYRQSDQLKECEKLYKKGLKKFPASGPLYNELGELQFQDKNADAVKTWEKGIEFDPAYSKNYYNAAKYYFFTADKVWSIYYGEIFVNMEPAGNRTPEMKQLLLDAYKKLFADTDIENNNKDNNKFVKGFLKTMNGQSPVAASGINTETLTMIRTRFILEWFAGKEIKIPVRLFNYQKELLREGMFEAYNQWLFAAAENLSAYDNWIKTHPAENNAFTTLQKSKIFKIPAGEYYH
jgi:tetratricopeptide (TPR) repeat protein